MKEQHFQKMLAFLGKDSLVIPTYGLILPAIALGENYRSEKVFILHKDLTMTYRGMSGAYHQPDLVIKDIKPEDRFLERANRTIADLCRNKLKRAAEESGVERLVLALIKMNELEFLVE